MSDLLATLMIHPFMLTRWQQMIMLLPLCLSVSIVYKTTKLSNLRKLPLAVLASWATVVGGMYAVGIVLLLLYEWAA